MLLCCVINYFCVCVQVIDVDERIFNYLEDPKRAVELKTQLKEEYRRASVALQKYDFANMYPYHLNDFS